MMLRGLGRSPFGPRANSGAAGGTRVVDPPALPAAEGPPPAAPAPVPEAPPAPAPARRNEASREVDPAQEQYEALKRHIHMRLVDRLDMNRIAEIDPKTLRNEIRGVVEQLCDTENPLLNRNERQRLVNEILDETFGFGPLELLLKDDKIGDIMINGAKNVYIEKEGRILKSEVGFRDNDHLLQIIDRIVSRVGRRVDETSPMVDARLPNGSRFNAIIPPLALDGPVVTIRMFGSRPLSQVDLLRYKAFTPEMLALLEGAMKARLNVIISGGTGSGKTTLLNTLSSFIQPDHRVITIEDAAELQLQQDHVVRLETRPCNIEGRGAVTATDLVKNALRMRPDRIIIGECRGAETLDMIQAMNTGHEGSMTTVHANTPRDALSRLETMISMAGLELPIRALRAQFASAVDLIVQASRLQGGPRKVTSISEVIGMEGDTIIMQEIFAFRQLGVDAAGRAHGEFIATGIRPSIMERLEQSGCHLPFDLFTHRVLSKD
jgi:pilus assembly protein CpaF